MHQLAASSLAVLAAASRANLKPAALLKITATAMAESHCVCRELSIGTCRICREADCLDRIATKAKDRAEAAEHIVDACLSTGADLLALLPGIVEGMLNMNPAACSCTGDTMCPICFAARELDLTARALAA
jgi:hypothetical protein